MVNILIKKREQVYFFDLVSFFGYLNDNVIRSFPKPIISDIWFLSSNIEKKLLVISNNYTRELKSKNQTFKN